MRGRTVSSPIRSPRRRSALTACRRIVHRRRQLRDGRADPGVQGRRRAAAHGGVRSAAYRAPCMPARKFGFEHDDDRYGQRHSRTTSVDALVVISDASRFARGARRAPALRAGKHVFVEKPLALTADGAGGASRPRTGRPAQTATAPHAHGGVQPPLRAADRTASRRLLAATTEPKAFVMTVNAGADSAGPLDAGSHPSAADGSSARPATSSTCCAFLVGAPDRTSQRRRQCARRAADTVTISLTFADGSIGTIHYLANGSKIVREGAARGLRGGARVCELDNFRKLTGYGWPGFK